MLRIPNILEKIGLDENVECKNLYLIEYTVNQNSAISSCISLVQAVNRDDAERTFLNQTMFNGNKQAIAINNIKQIDLKVQSNILFEYTNP